MLAGGILSALSIGRFLLDWKRSDAIDIILLFISGLIDIIVGQSASSLDFECTGGTNCINGIQSYTGQYYFFYLFSPIGIICWMLTIMAVAVTLGTVFKKRTRGY